MENQRHQLSVSYALGKLAEYRVINKIAYDSELSATEKTIFKIYYDYAYKNLKE